MGYSDLPLHHQAILHALGVFGIFLIITFFPKIETLLASLIGGKVGPGTLIFKVLTYVVAYVFVTFVWPRVSLLVYEQVV